MIGITSRGDHRKTTNFLEKLRRGDIYSDLDRYGQMGVAALSQATPQDTGETAMSWDYRVIRGKRPSIEWFNTNKTIDGTPIAILIQYGHGTGTGGYVMGMDYINPAMRPIFQKIADEVWKKVRLG